MQEEPTVGVALIRQVKTRLTASYERIKHCLEQLDDSQVWWRPEESMNSVGNILLHLCGNLRQWIIDGVVAANNSRNRPQEFAERSMIPKDELIGRLDTVLAEANRVLTGISDLQLLEARRIQGFDETVLFAILNSLTHFSGHAQEIVYITRLQLGYAVSVP